MEGGTLLIYFIPTWKTAKCTLGRGVVWLRQVRARTGVGRAEPGAFEMTDCAGSMVRAPRGTSIHFPSGSLLK